MSDITDEEYIETWTQMLSVFKGLIADNPLPAAIAMDLGTLKNMAVETNLLTLPQQRAIIDRCDNYLDGSYGLNLANPYAVKERTRSK